MFTYKDQTTDEGALGATGLRAVFQGECDVLAIVPPRRGGGKRGRRAGWQCLS